MYAITPKPMKIMSFLIGYEALAILVTFFVNIMSTIQYKAKEQNNSVDRKSPLVSRWVKAQISIPTNIGCLNFWKKFVLPLPGIRKITAIGIKTKANSRLYGSGSHNPIVSVIRKP